jgi:hypothetical protein
MRLPSFVAAVALLSACHSYRPLPVTAPATGLKVRALLTDSGTRALAQYVGPDVSAIEGRVADGGDDGLTLSVGSVETRDGTEHYWKGERVLVPRNLIALLQEERVSPERSSLLGGALAVGAFVAYKAFGIGNNGGGSQKGGTGGGTTQ